MQRVFIFVLIIASLSVKAQSVYPVSIMDYMHPVMFGRSIPLNDSIANKKWSVSSFAGISTSISFFNGGHATAIAVPLVLQLNRRLSNNWYAFAAISAAPAYVNLYGNFNASGINKASPYNGFMQSNNLGVYSKAELGLMYVNDAKTFSISGSIGVENSTHPIMQYYPVRSNPAVPQKH